MSDAKGDRVFKALSAPVRRTLLDVLRDGPTTTGRLCVLFPALDRCTVMLHLKVLEEAGLLIVERHGRERWNHLNPLPIKDIYDRWMGLYASQPLEPVPQALQPARSTAAIPEF